MHLFSSLITKSIWLRARSYGLFEKDVPVVRLFFGKLSNFQMRWTDKEIVLFPHVLAEVYLIKVLLHLNVVYLHSKDTPLCSTVIININPHGHWQWHESWKSVMKVLLCKQNDKLGAERLVIRHQNLGKSKQLFTHNPCMEAAFWITCCTNKSGHRRWKKKHPWVYCWHTAE